MVKLTQDEPVARSVERRFAMARELVDFAQHRFGAFVVRARDRLVQSRQPRFDMRAQSRCRSRTRRSKAPRMTPAMVA